MSKSNGIKSQAVVVITVMTDGAVVFRADNSGKGLAAKLADATARLGVAVLDDELQRRAGVPDDHHPAGAAGEGAQPIALLSPDAV